MANTDSSSSLTAYLVTFGSQEDLEEFKRLNIPGMVIENAYTAFPIAKVRIESADFVASFENAVSKLGGTVEKEAIWQIPKLPTQPANQ